MLDFNREHVGQTDFNQLMNAVLDAGAKAAERETHRNYLGASSIGSDCMRKIQFDWTRESIFPAKTMRIFDRGHLMEDMAVKAFAAAGIRMERGTHRTRFECLDGRFKGHCDGVILAGPSFLQVPALWEHKALGDRGWEKIEADGLKVGAHYYYDQVQIYMAYLDLVDHPAVFTATNANTCEMLHLLVPFDAAAAQAASDRAVMIVRAQEAGELMPRIAKSPTDWRCKRCNHKEACWTDTSRVSTA